MQEQHGCRTVGEFLGYLNEGTLPQGFMEALREVADGMQDFALATNGKAKASLTLKLSFTLDSGITVIGAEIVTKLPELPPAKTAMFLTPDGHFSPHNPRQHILPGMAPVRSVDPATGEVINVGA